MSRSPGPALLSRSRSRTIGLGNTGTVTAGTQEHSAVAGPASAELDRLRGAVSAALSEFFER